MNNWGIYKGILLAGISIRHTAHRLQGTGTGCRIAVEEWLGIADNLHGKGLLVAIRVADEYFTVGIVSRVRRTFAASDWVLLRMLGLPVAGLSIRIVNRRV